MPNWFKTDKALEDGDYWWRENEEMEPVWSVVQNGKTSDIILGSKEITGKWFDDFFGYWSGPIEPPVFDVEENA